MEEIYRSDLQAHVLIDDQQRVRAIRHTQAYWESDLSGGLETAAAYLRAHADVFGIDAAALDHLESRTTFLTPQERPEEYRLLEHRQQFDSETFGFCQTVHNVPVWGAGLKVTIKQGPSRVVSARNTSLDAPACDLPPARVIERYRKALAAATTASLRHRAVRADPELRQQAGSPEGDADGDRLLRSLLKTGGGGEADAPVLRLIRGRFWVYRYAAAARLPEDGGAAEPRKKPPARRRRRASAGEVEDQAPPRPFDIGTVSERIREGGDYLVAEITFEVTAGADRHVWRVLVEPETGSVLYLRPLSAHVDGLVYEQDPITKTGNTGLASDADTATLNPHRDDVVLANLAPPMGGNNRLTGDFAEVTQSEGPDIDPPQEPVASDFDYDVRTNDFASVSGYFHVDRIFRTMQSLGFHVPSYMSNTVFPVPVDIRCFDAINAHCVGDGMGGIGHTGYGLMDTTDTTNPLGRACDPRVHLHEVLGHGILYEAVDGPNMGFTHSAGDSLALIYFDPDSQCRGIDGTPLGKPGDLRFTYVPWHPTLDRRCDRDVADGWAWNGAQDNGGYGSEEILATTLFNVYRSIGGDHPDLARREFASRMTMYLVLRAIGNLTPATNPQYARDFAAELMTTDALNWTSEGVFGGAYHKVIRWAFEQQGEYQTPLVTSGSAADGTITAAGQPPEVDVYIDDGRGGAYPFQQVHWQTTTIWSRREADGVEMHQEPALGATNYAYVKIRNRGTEQASNVIVYGFHTRPGAGLMWPNDFDPLDTPFIIVGTLAGNDSAEAVVGPFEWTPHENAFGHDCLLMVVSADGDPANIGNFTAGETIPEWRLVPNDNNVGQRNVNPVAGGCGKKGLMASLDGKSFRVGNPNPRRGKSQFDVHLPAVLADRGWRLELTADGGDGALPSGARREVTIRLHPGKPFSREDVAATADRDIRIDVRVGGLAVGGMTYRLDPDICRPWNDCLPDDRCVEKAQKLADCLGIDQEIGEVCVKEVIVSLKVRKGDDCC